MIADVIEQIVVVTGRVLHGGSGEPVQGDVDVTVDRPGVSMKYLEDGTFALSGRPELLFPDLATQAYTLQLKVVARSRQWRTGKMELALAPVTVPMGHDFLAAAGMLVVSPFPAGSPAGTIFLAADPVEIRGRVTRGGAPVAGASIAILPSTGPAPPPQTSGADGWYGFAAVTVPPGSSIRCTTAVATLQRLLLIEYAQAVQNESFRLPA